LTVHGNGKTLKEDESMPVKPSDKEEEYFAKQQYEKKKKIEEEKHKNLAAAEKTRLKDLHYMRCPKCGMELIEIDYKNIKIDRCSECKGIWLDPGELETVGRIGKTGIDKFFSIFK
jgi:uncharacterized protein